MTVSQRTISISTNLQLLLDINGIWMNWSLGKMSPNLNPEDARFGSRKIDLIGFPESNLVFDRFSLSCLLPLLDVWLYRLGCFRSAVLLYLVVASWIFWELFHTRWKIFVCQGACKYACEVRMSTWDEIVYVRWKCPHRVRMCTWGENAHMRWECPCKVKCQNGGGDIPPYLRKWSCIWGENALVRWECLCKVKMLTVHHTLETDLVCMCPHKVRMSMWDENAHMNSLSRWWRSIPPYLRKWCMWGGNAHSR